MAKKLFYKIGETCKLLDIQPYVLRYWETEFPFLKPDKSRSGQRVYGESEVQMIRRVKELLYEEGYTIAGAKKKLESEIAAGLSGSGPAEIQDGESEPDAPPLPAAVGEAPEQEPDLRAEPQPAAWQEVLPVPQFVPPALELDRDSRVNVEKLRLGIAEALSQSRELLQILRSP